MSFSKILMSMETVSLNGRQVIAITRTSECMLLLLHYKPQEFTSFTVEKANLLNKRAKLTSIAHYHDSSHNLDPSAFNRHRHDISRFVNIPTLGQFAIVVRPYVFFFFSYCYHIA